MSFEKFHLAILGAHTLLGAEVARLAVALGHDVSGLDSLKGPPAWASHEPWTHGVTWLSTQDAGALAAVDRVVICGMPSEEGTYANEDALLHIVSLVLASSVEHLVLVGSHEMLHAHRLRDLLREPVACGVRVVYMSPVPILWTPHVNVQGGERAPDEGAAYDEGVQRVELVAMATLRAVLEDEHHGELDRATIAVLGDAMMIQ